MLFWVAIWELVFHDFVFNKIPRKKTVMQIKQYKLSFSKCKKSKRKKIFIAAVWLFVIFGFSFSFLNVLNDISSKF